MGLLLYKSNEMFSATQLIRQSKMIFDKIINKDIEKAIILRDGKPGFLLMDFEKYEKIMSEYEKLQNQIAKQKKQKKIDTKQTTVSKDIHSFTQTNIPKADVVDKPMIKDEDKNQNEKIEPVVKIESLEDKQDEIKEDTEKDKQELTVEQEIAAAMRSIDSMNFDDNMKNIAKEKIKLKILKARQEREKLLKEQEEHEKEQLKEELELQAQIKKVKKKKEKELAEFWD